MKSTINPKLYSRYFNRLTDLGSEYQKCSSKKEKLKQEFNFLNTIPKILQPYYPKVHSFTESDEAACYKIQKIESLDCSHLMLTPNIDPNASLKELLGLIKTYLSKVDHHQTSASSFSEAVNREILLKNSERVAELNNLKVGPHLNQICEKHGLTDLNTYLDLINAKIRLGFQEEDSRRLYYSHGDLCFSNLLIYKNQLFLIDPKGALHPEHNYRPIHYELAKLSQSLLGHYDLINHELFALQYDKLVFNFNPIVSSHVQKLFQELINSFGTNLNLIRLIEASLFLSLIPFHQDSLKKMEGFLTNSISIFKEATCAP